MDIYGDGMDGLVWDLMGMEMHWLCTSRCGGTAGEESWRRIPSVFTL